MDWKSDEQLKVLLEKGKLTGSLTFEEINAALPEMSEPDRLAEIQEHIETLGIQLLDAEDEDGEGEAVSLADEILAEAVDSPSFEDSDGDGRHIDDPVRMYLTQMGEIPLLDCRQEVSLAMKIELTRRRFRRKVLECDYALRQVTETLKRVHIGDPTSGAEQRGRPNHGRDKEKHLQQIGDDRLQVAKARADQTQ